MADLNIVELTGLTFGEDVNGPSHSVPLGQKIVWYGTYPSGGGYRLENEKWTASGGVFAQQAEYEDSTPQVWRYIPFPSQPHLNPVALFNARTEHLRAFEGFVRHEYDLPESDNWAEGVTLLGAAPTTTEYQSGADDLEIIDNPDGMDTQIVTDTVYTRQTVGWTGMSTTPVKAVNTLGSRLKTYINQGKNEFLAATDPPGGETMGVVWRPVGGGNMNSAPVLGTQEWRVVWTADLTGIATGGHVTIGYVDDDNPSALGYPRATREFATQGGLRDAFEAGIIESDIGVYVFKEMTSDDYVNKDGKHTFIVTLWWKPDWGVLHTGNGFFQQARISLRQLPIQYLTKYYTMIYPSLQFGYIVKANVLEPPRRQMNRTDGLIGAGRQGKVVRKQAKRIW